MDKDKKIEIKKSFMTIYEALEPLDDEARSRVFMSVATIFGINANIARSSASFQVDEILEGEHDLGENYKSPPEYSTFAELYSRADPISNSDKALVAGYWLQVCQGADNFSGFSINGELTNLGHKLSNVTNALSSLINMKPQLVLQIKKTGKSRQARKTYKLSKAGIDQIQEMIGG